MFVPMSLDIDHCIQRYVNWNALLIFSYCRSTGCWHVQVYNVQQTLPTAFTPFINITITQLCKPMTSQFDD